MQSIVEQIKNILVLKQWRLAVAESLTGGLCQSTLVSCPGISQVFSGGVVSYTNDIKQSVLKVDSDTLLKKTAVSEEVAEQMVIGVKHLFQSDVAISFTGEAGPFTQVGVLGQVFISIIIDDNIQTKLYYFSGNRHEIRYQAAQQGLLFLLKQLQNID